MKKIFAILSIAAALALSACNPEEQYASGTTGIEFLFDEIDVDLNISDNPYITCVINSTAGLKKVQMFLNYEDGSSVQYKDDITGFFNPEIVSLYERPVYSGDMTGLTVKATDLGGKVVEKTVTFNVKPVVLAPEVKFSSESISFSEGDPISEFGFTVASMAPLSKVCVELIAGGEVSPLLEDITDFSDPLYLEFSSMNYPVGDYDLGKIPGSIRVTAVDTYGKVSMSALPINYHSLPYPEVSVDALPTTEEFSPLTVSGSASSESRIVEVRCYAVGDKYEHLAAAQAVAEKESTDFSLSVPAEEIQEYVTGIKVVAKDYRGKETSKTVNLTVLPGFWQLKSSDNLLGFLAEKAEDPRFRSLKIALPAGATFDLGTSSVTLKKGLHLKGPDSGELPTVTTTAAEPIKTDVLTADYVRFENIHFKSIKSSNAGLVNNAGGCSIGEVSFKGCLFDGTYGNYLIRAGGNCKVGELKVDDCVFRWNNSNSSYSLLHITNNSDRVAAITLRNSTVEGVFYLIYNNQSNTECAVSIESCTFVNSKASSNSYLISIGQSSQKGSFSMKKCLFGGTCNLTGTSRCIVTKSLVSETSDNFCTKTWMSFRLDSGTANAYMPATVLPDSEDNAQIFTDLGNFDLTLRKGTSVYNAGIGDPRWIK